MSEERLKLAIFIDFDNVQIGVKDTLGKEFDVSVVLEALKERGEVVTKIAYGDWHRAGEQSRQMTQHAVQMVQRNVTPRGDKNGADINLALDALEMAFTRDHINTFAIVGGDSDFIALVEKLKQYGKRVFVVGGRAFTSQILQRNCHEFIAYENLLESAASDGRRTRRPAPRASSSGRALAAPRPLAAALPSIQRALKILAEREVAPQLGLLKSTLLQLDPTFSERDYGAGSFLEFMQKMQRAGLLHLRRTERGFLVEPVEGDGEARLGSAPAPAAREPEAGEQAAVEQPSPPAVAPSHPDDGTSRAEAMGFLKQAVAGATEKSPERPLYLRQIRQGLRSVAKDFDARRYDFRAILDLLHEAQREGWVRLQRDRKGVWRIFPVSPSLLQPLAPAVVSEPAPDSAAAGAASLPADVDGRREESTLPEELEAAPESPAMPAPSTELVAIEPAGESGARRRGTRAAATRHGLRKASVRRKAKELTSPSTQRPPE